jgi:hypothetical protein
MDSRCAANEAGILELGRKRRRGNVLHGIGKYRLCFLDVGSREINGIFYESQTNSLKIDSWVKILREEIEKLGLPYIWQSQADIKINRVFRAINNTIERQNLFAGFNQNYSLKYCCEETYMK